MKSRQSGLTMVEMIATMVVAAVLLVMAQFGLMAVASTRTIAEANRLIMDINYTRSEAIKWGEVAGMCIADSIDFCVGNSPARGGCRCKSGAAAKTYHDGWLIFIDLDRDGRYDSDTEELLRVGLPPSPGIEMVSNNAIQMGLSLNATGAFLDGTEEGKVYVCFEGESTPDAPGRIVVLHVSGRTEIKEIAPGESCRPQPVQ